jgi:hypothetical protein
MRQGGIVTVDLYSFDKSVDACLYCIHCLFSASHQNDD